MSRQAIWAIGLILGAALIATAMIMLRPEPEEADVVATIPLVQTVQYSVIEGPLEILTTGTVQAREEVTLGAELAGKLTYVNPSFRAGSAVGAGSLLFRIEQSDYRNRVRSAQADVAAQNVAVLQAQEEVSIAEAELRRFEQRETSRTALSQSVDGNDYAARILPPGGLPSSQTAPAADVASPNQLATREPQLQSAQAARDRAAAGLADAQLALTRTEVRAPFSGIVRSESVATGTLVQPGQSLGSIVATDFFEVRVSLTEADAVLIPSLFAAGRSRIPARVMLDYGDRSYWWSGFVDRADPILDPQTRTIAVFLRIPSPMRGGTPVMSEDEEDAPATNAPPLLLGSFVRASITGGTASPYAAIPLDALRSDDTVWLLRQGRLNIVSVEVIQRTDEFAYVTSPDLGDGGQVITSTLSAPVEGMAMRSDASAERSTGE